MAKASIIIGYKNRDIGRVRHALNSYEKQSCKDFELIFVDYGSDFNIASQVKELVEAYHFARYYYSETRGWFWNRAHALNTGINLAKGQMIVISDIDLLLPTDFIEKLKTLSLDNTFYTFSCYYLPQNIDPEYLTSFNLETADIHYVGLCVVKTEYLIAISGFDEYYMNWGGEDDDLYVRLEAKGIKKQTLGVSQFKVLHQWHPKESYKYPTPWYLEMVDYLYSQKSSSNYRGEGYGLLISEQDRPVMLSMGDYHIFSKLNLFPNPLFQYNVFIDNFFKMKSGEFGLFEFPLQYNSTWSSDKKVIRLINKIISITKYNYSIQRKVLQPTHCKDKWIEFVMYFIGKNRPFVADYFLINNENQLALYFQKA